MLRIALAQINPTVGDFPGNLAKIVAFARCARTAKADLVAFPELALCGYPPEDLLLKDRFLKANRSYLSKLARRVDSTILICGVADRQRRVLYNAAALLQRGELKLNYHKVDLPNYGVFDEKRYFEPGNKVALFDLGGVRIGLSVCEDIWVNGGVCQAQAQLGAQLLINISSSPYHLHKFEERLKLLQQVARENRVYVAYVNTVGGQDELVFDGGSLVLDPAGVPIARAPQFIEDLLVVDLPISARRNQPSLPKGISVGESLLAVEHQELAPPRWRGSRRRQPRRLADRLPEAEEVYQALVLGTRDYVRKNGFQRVMIGLSGGVDSALTAAIAVDALGPQQVETLFMPSRYTSKLSRELVEKQVHLLGIRLRTVAIDELVAAYEDSLRPFFFGRAADITEENIQARIRGNLLMAFSNKFGYLVLNTANKSEAAVGYSTLYGDMVGGFAVLEDIPKTLLYKICRHLNRNRGREVIARGIIRRPPSAELKADQRDTDSLPPYDALDQILRAFVEEDRDVAEIVKLGFERKLVERVVRLVIGAEYKRRQSAPVIKITPRAFGKDRRWPITNKFIPKRNQTKGK